jgi:hypothetical protein
MSGRNPLFRLVLAALAITLGSLIAFVAFSKKLEAQRKVTTPPPAYSKIKDIEVVGAKLINEGTPAAGVAVEVRNNSSKAVTAIDLVCGDGAVTKNGLTDEQNPLVVIEPFKTTTIEMSFSEMTADAPLVISAVTYADGTEEGDAKSLGIMHKIREHDRQRLQKERKP